MSVYIAAAVQGFLFGASLIIAIGAQNAFVLRQGLVARHVGPVVAVCALSDAVLISLGAAGMGSLVMASERLFIVLVFAGAAFLVWYGFKAARRMLAPSSLAAAEAATGGLGATLLTVALLTWANPHVYLDTVVLLGGVSGLYPPAPRVAFALGAMLASLTWFTSLGYGARLLQPVFRKPVAWRVLDGLISIVMLGIAAELVVEGLKKLG
jgi:L-lysine exporter family protein LysE/ArgO